MRPARAVRRRDAQVHLDWRGRGDSVTWEALFLELLNLGRDEENVEVAPSKRSPETPKPQTSAAPADQRAIRALAPGKNGFPVVNALPSRRPPARVPSGGPATNVTLSTA